MRPDGSSPAVHLSFLATVTALVVDAPRTGIVNATVRALRRLRDLGDLGHWLIRAADDARFPVLDLGGRNPDRVAGADTAATVDAVPASVTLRALSAAEVPKAIHGSESDLYVSSGHGVSLGRFVLYLNYGAQPSVRASLNARKPPPKWGPSVSY